MSTDIFAIRRRSWTKQIAIVYRHISDFRLMKNVLFHLFCYIIKEMFHKTALSWLIYILFFKLNSTHNAKIHFLQTSIFLIFRTTIFLVYRLTVTARFLIVYNREQCLVRAFIHNGKKENVFPLMNSSVFSFQYH